MKRWLMLAVSVVLGSTAQADVALSQTRLSTDRIFPEIIYSRSLLNVPTTGTSEEVLGTITIPAGTFSNPAWAGVRIQAVVIAAANTNAKSVRVRVGGLSGVAIMAHTGDTTSGNRFSFSADLMPVVDGEVSGIAQSTRRTGTSFIFTMAAVTGLTFSGPIDVVVTGQTATAAGDLILVSLRGELLPAKF